MNPDHTHFAQWDAAYVLGALSPSDRRDFEAHLDECPDCRRAIAELTPTVGLLSRISAQDAEAIDDDDLDEDSAGSAAVLSLARERSRRRRRLRVVALVAAAVLVIAAVAVPLSVSSFVPRPTESFALQSTTDVPLEASVQLTSVGWGTRIELSCRYPEDDESGAPEEGWTYALTVVDSAGEASNVSTWRSRPGANARLQAGTALDVSDIRSVEIRTMSGQILMSYDLPQTSEG
ncbi:zf-HC2 domain-containing protein [Microbacterium sp. 4R-513]|uniref:anti-sigma factor family protein n=1 Tax=Microbacterium sp. 4R-513 TaxID=2567934 RepID=UPI0013E1748D|nr:zf-HC2 domain-containing protein [Microbacterium sp. 4R-513]QIG40241.1 zf-HC2 domain-containing protein [Microbacterium sp. 4R-513]